MKMTLKELKLKLDDERNAKLRAIRLVKLA